MKLWIVQACVVHHTTDLYGVSEEIVRQLPTFYLDANQLGIVSKEHAEQIAKEIICPFEPQYESVTVHASAAYFENF